MAKTKGGSMINNNDEDTSTGTTSLLGKFRERLLLFRKQKLQKVKKDNNTFLIKRVTNLKNKFIIIKNTSHKIALYPYKRLKNINKPRKSKITLIKKSPYIIALYPYKKKKNLSLNPKTNLPNNDEFIKNVLDRINKTRQDRNNTNKKGINNKIIINKEQEQKETEIKVKIINTIKQEFIKKKAELEIIETNLYNLEKEEKTTLNLEKIKIIQEEIEEIISKINNIIIDYNLYDYDNLSNLDDSNLLNDIITYKNLLNQKKDSNLEKGHKLLEEFQALYQKLDRVKTISNEIIITNQESTKELIEEKEDYTNIKNDISNLDYTVTKCKDEISRQNTYLKEVMSKVDTINKNEYTSLKFKSFNEIVSKSLLWLGTLSLSKKAPLIPRIFINTLATGLLIKNISKNFFPEKITKIEYSATNYDKEITKKMYDLDYTNNLVSDTLYQIKNLKSDFTNTYNNNSKEYTDTLNKLSKIEDNILKNQEQIKYLKTNLNKGKEQNKEKIKKLENLKKNT